jgi:pantoate--beta-alanine ligase
MGNLHAGHIQLLNTARQKAERVVVSIFVNPAQFGPNEDYNHYPRTEKQDQAALLEHGADLLFLPSVTEMYPQPPQTIISVKDLSALHCGASRPGHFDGVALVVCKLLNIIQPDLLFLGEKDYQQLSLIRRMASDLNFSVEIHGVPTARETDGLALSSRNGFLTAEQRLTAPLLYQALCAVRDDIQAGCRNYPTLLNQQIQLLQQAGFELDYFNISRSIDLQPAGPEDNNLVILLAAKLGNTRLIDNLCVQLNN